MINFYLDKLSEEEQQTLAYLARRSHPDIRDNIWYFVGLYGSHTCCICNATFTARYYLYGHGLQHLKESNLLPFI